MISKLEEPSKISETISIRKYKDAIYIGELGAENKRSGNGVMIY
jgi:hypothetical protein